MLAGGSFKAWAQGLVIHPAGDPGPQPQGPDLEKNVLGDQTRLYVGDTTCALSPFLTSERL